MTFANFQISSPDGLRIPLKDLSSVKVVEGPRSSIAAWASGASLWV